MNIATSRDSTNIAYTRTGSGPALILVDGAMCSRGFGPSPTLAPLLARSFTVYTYDRRGRGESGDTQPSTKQREVEDIAALIAVAGGRANLAGLSSGAALAFEAAASGLDISRVAGYEPPYVYEGEPTRVDHEAALRRILATGDRSGAVKYFMRDMVGVPAPAVWMMRMMPWVWRKLAAVAHTLPYDAAVMGDFTAPTARLANIRVPALVMHGSRTDARLQTAAHAVAAAIPGARHQVLAGQTHNVRPNVLVPALVEFFTAP